MIEIYIKMTKDSIIAGPPEDSIISSKYTTAPSRHVDATKSWQFSPPVLTSNLTKFSPKKEKKSWQF